MSEFKKLNVLNNLNNFKRIKSFIKQNKKSVSFG